MQPRALGFGLGGGGLLPTRSPKTHVGFESLGFVLGFRLKIERTRSWDHVQKALDSGLGVWF